MDRLDPKSTRKVSLVSLKGGAPLRSGDDTWAAVSSKAAYMGSALWRGS
jgi:hypothetical protein